MSGLLHLPFVERGVIDVAILAVGAGIAGTWIVLRGLAFYAHALGTAAFPGLVLADGLGFGPGLGALGAAGLFAASVGREGSVGRRGPDAFTGLVLAGALAGGAILASNVFASGARVETLLFGSLLLIGPQQLLLTAAASAAVLVASVALGPRWLQSGFDPAVARRSGPTEPLLFAVIALSAVAALMAVGALLAGALLVIPAATARGLAGRVATWQLASIALAALEGVIGLLLSVRLDAPPGAVVAVLAAVVFALGATTRRFGRRVQLAAVTGVLLIGTAFGLTGEGAAAPVPGRVAVVATTTEAADFARAIGGPAVDVRAVLRPNTDPHGYEPRAGDVVATAHASLVVASGAGLDGWIASVLSAAGRRPALDLSARLPVRLRGSNGKLDPHWWHDPVDVEAAIVRLRDALIRADPAHREAYSATARRYERRLRALTRRIRQCIGGISPARRVLVTTHDAFSYFARRFGIRVLGAIVPAQAAEAAPSAGDLAELLRLIRLSGVRTVFLERSGGEKLARAVAGETGARSDFRLYGDSLGPAGSPGATYLGMEQANADALVRGFTAGTRGC